MENTSENLLLHSHETSVLLEEIRLLKADLIRISDLLSKEKKKEKLFGDWIHEKELMELTGLSRNTLYLLSKAGKVVKSSIAGKNNYYKMSDFKKLLEENKYK